MVTTQDLQLPAGALELLIIQPTPVKEPVTGQPLPPAKAEGYFSHRIREILAQS